MTDALHATMLDTVVSYISSSLITVDSKEKIAYITISRHNSHNLQYFIGKNLFNLLKKACNAGNYQLLYNAYKECVTSHQSVHISKIFHIGVRGLSEYFSCDFSFVSEQNCVIIFIKNITESILIEEEFTCMSEQYESLNRDLYIAMSNLEFRMMDIEQAHKKIAALYRITSIVQKTVNEQEVLNEILDGITRELGFTHVSILLYDEKRKELKTKAQRGFADDVRIPLGDGITGYAALHRELVYVEDVSQDSRYIPRNNGCISEVAIPLVVGDKLLGVLNVETMDGRILQPYDLDLLRSLASQVAVTIAHASHVSKVEVQAITDGLTGLYNYRYFRTILEQELKRAVRYKRPLSLIMIDIDYFKHYNDANGHLAGDSVLSTVATLAKQACRDVDFVVRYGGEEFAILLPETIVDEACILAERIRKGIAEHVFPNGSSQPNGAVTVSIGISNYPQDAYYDIELIECADIALYTAKHSGRNCVKLYGNCSI
ncbi:hypothetical protein P22_0321 [Propionispora sp. 2/2-37]|uniref:diguanylate cyclase n=1 Tax=Propionispora sp. 2/2-37 TaxID=1677858 RepID=UPI0006BB8F17|nr:diguanylate cyclase [Propionispora sp. 2/2-37]CUH94255.1 hypothetical protein P22_0321 [Propionispora sp. 2/2-37]